MTAGRVQVQHAEQAVQLGMAVAEATMAAAQATPGVGFQVALPSVVGALGRPTQGEGYNLPASTPALRPVPHVDATPSYGSPLVAGISHNGSTGYQDALEGVPAPRPPAYRFVSASSPRTPLLGRVKAAFGVLLGRR